MSYISLNPENNQALLNDQKPAKALNSRPEKSSEIRQGMSPKEIADVVSDHLICNVKKQFESVKTRLMERSL